MRLVPLALAFLAAIANAETLTGKAAVAGDWTEDAPAVSRWITIDDLPPPFTTDSVDNGPSEIRPPAAAQLRVPPGFKIEQYANGFRDPRFLLTAPKGDIFVTESR